MSVVRVESVVPAYCHPSSEKDDVKVAYTSAQPTVAAMSRTQANMDKMGIDNALITCRENNIGSIKTMNKFIGTADSLIPSRYEGIMEYRYWVDVKKNIKELANDKKINM